MGASIRGRLQPVVATESTVASQQYLSFMTGGGVFGIVISAIKEIIEYRAPTDVPMMPACIGGVINLRGRVVPVVDLSVRFGRAKSEITRRSCIVMVEIQQDQHCHDIGVMVDAVSAVVEIADADIEPPPAFGAKLRADFIAGLGKVNENFVVILNIDKVLSIDELAMLDVATDFSDSNVINSVTDEGIR